MTRIYIYDTTLRDGSQTPGVNFSPSDKHRISRVLDSVGFDYIEGGWPGANHTDDTFFSTTHSFSNAKLCAFGMTKKDASSQSVPSSVQAVTIVGKAWDYQVTVALGMNLDENLRMIRDNITFLSKVTEVMFDAEHFFDGYKRNPDYALSVVKTAYESGARWVVLCDTNGGSLPHEIHKIINHVINAGIPGENLGIHCHNDTELAVSNSLTAVQAGVRQVQGTIGGLGERCGNANLISIVPTLMLKMGYSTGVSRENLTHLVNLSNMLSDVLGQNPSHNQPYVGTSAFSHKGGLHVSAVNKDPSCYEHIDPALVGNTRQILVSDQAGKSNLNSRLTSMGIDISSLTVSAMVSTIHDLNENIDTIGVTNTVDVIKRLEHYGYSYDIAPASFELLVRRSLGQVPRYFKLNRYRVIDERRRGINGDWITLSEATIRIDVDGTEYMQVSEGNGPIHAFDAALRNVLTSAYPEAASFQLTDFRVRIVESSAGTKSKIRVTIESSDGTNRWTTVGVHTNLIEASLEALQDAVSYMLYISRKDR